MPQAKQSKSPKSAPRKLTPDEVGDCWIMVEDAADSEDPRVLRAGFDAALELLDHVALGGRS
jgi:hypothetical protein